MLFIITTILVKLRGITYLVNVQLYVDLQLYILCIQVLECPIKRERESIRKSEFEKRLITRVIKSGCYIPGYSVDKESSRFTPQPVTKDLNPTQGFHQKLPSHAK